MHRIGLDVVPAHVREAVEDELGAAIAGWANKAGGYSPSLAARCELTDGRVVFVKAVSPAQNPESPDMLRRELFVGAALPSSLPAPRLLARHDDGTWVAGAWAYVMGRQPGAPWTGADLDATFAALHELAEACAPSPVDGLPRWADQNPRGWAELASSPAPDPRLDPWTVRHLDALAAVEARWPDAVAGDSLVHNDIRSDNLVIADEDGSVWITDWANVQIGAPWIDMVSWFPAMVLEGGPPCEEALARAGRLPGDPDEAAVTTYLVALAGYFTHRALQPPPPGLPTLRPFQAAQGEVARAWVAARTGLR